MSLDLESFLNDLREAEDYRGQIAHIEHIPARRARYGELTHRLHPRLTDYLRASGIERLYTHQAAAINSVLDGKHVTIVTSTASGKTLCYNLPVLHTQLTSPGKNALYLFPTKALAQDQMRKLRDFGLTDGPRFGIYDGDTSASERRHIRRNCHTILTNPDMLHVGILPYHHLWADFLRNLAFVVIDEMHIYRGVFGAHVGNVIRRLRRICRRYGSVPQFISCSATIGNPEELMSTLTGVRSEVVDDDGSPSGERWIVFWNPPFIGEGERKSSNSEAAALFSRLVRSGIRNITFTKARVVAELIYRYAQADLSNDPDAASKIMSYRGGYTAEQRRAIERALFEGSLVGVTATTALELGIDVGDLDACVLTGYPGSISSTWQQIGRAGRGRQSSLAILVALNNPVDQFIVRNPDYFFDSKNERAIVDPRNPYILAEHLLCATYELPVSDMDYPLFGDHAEQILQVLQTTTGRIAREDRHWRYVDPDTYPAREVNIRAAGGACYSIHDKSDPQCVLGTVEEAAAFQVLHEGAVYLHQGETYVVESLDTQNRRAFVARRDVDYYTVPSTVTHVRIESEESAKKQGRGSVHYGRLSVSSQVTGYRRRQVLTDIVLDEVAMLMPCQTFETEGLWFTFHQPLPSDVRERQFGLEGGAHGLEHAFIGVMPLCALCDRLDIGGAAHPLHPQTGVPTVFVYDAHPGGVGICQAAFDRIGDLLLLTLKVVSECPCHDGCPSCIQSPKCGDNNFPLDKQSAVVMLRSLM